MYQRIFLFLILLAITAPISGQEVGIGTNTPTRVLEVEGSTPQFVRVRTSGIGSESSFEMTNPGLFGYDQWSIQNDNSVFKIFRSIDVFDSRDEVLRMNPSGYLGIGTHIPTSLVHIDKDDGVSLPFGHIMLGQSASKHLMIDEFGIICRNNGAPEMLILQPLGGNVVFQENGGSVRFGWQDNGNVRINDAPSYGKFNIRDNGFQVLIENDVSNNTWYIGSSAGTWNAGDDQLLFSPAASTNDAILRLRTISESDGITAPVEIHSSASQQLLLDGNEIDSKSGALYINHNTGNNTLINIGGGNVGVGTGAATATLHLSSPNAGYPPLWMKVGDSNTWAFDASTVTGNFLVHRDGAIFSFIEDDSGLWNGVSDRRLKTHIDKAEPVLDDVLALDILSYAFDHDPATSRNLGMIAQEVAKVFPEVVHQGEEGFGIAYSQLSVIAIRALQEQADQIDALKARLELLIEK